MRNEERSLNGDLHEGSTDGKYYKLAPNRGGHVETNNALDRAHLATALYGTVTQEMSPKAGPGGHVVP